MTLQRVQLTAAQARVLRLFRFRERLEGTMTGPICALLDLGLVVQQRGPRPPLGLCLFRLSDRGMLWLRGLL